MTESTHTPHPALKLFGVGVAVAIFAAVKLDRVINGKRCDGSCCVCGNKVVTADDDERRCCICGRIEPCENERGSRWVKR